MASTMDMLINGAQQQAAGKQLDSNTIGLEEGETSPATSDMETEARAENSTLEDMLPGGEGEDTPADSSETSKNAEKAAADSKEATPKTSSAKEVITVTDETGRRRKIEIDYTDRAAIKKAHEMANGARKWQADRDREVKGRQTAETQLTEFRSNWEKLETAFQSGGVSGLVDLLEGQGAWKNHVSKEIQKAKFLENASPEEVQALQGREQAERQARELDKLRKDNEDFKKKITQERETAELRSLESQVHPVFNKYRFAEKLGDENDEHMFDEMLWQTSLKRLEDYEAKGHEISPSLIEREFASTASAIRKRIGLQAEKRATKVVEQKKREATENVQAKVMSGYKTGGAAKEARDLLQSGNLTGLLKNWGKYGGLFRK